MYKLHLKVVIKHLKVFLASLLINLTSGDFYTYYEIEKKAYSENEEIQMKAINLMTVEH